jgi:probable rRNA maturation factor
MSTQSPIRFFFENKSVSLRNRTRLKAFIKSIFKQEGKSVESLNYIFCSDKRILEINRQFLNHDYYTDIITFDLSESAQITAEIYISLDRVRDNAKTQATTLQSELHRVIFHGALHLCGYRDKTKAEIKVMRGKEEEWIGRWKMGV